MHGKLMRLVPDCRAVHVHSRPRAHTYRRARAHSKAIWGRTVVAPAVKRSRNNRRCDCATNINLNNGHDPGSVPAGEFPSGPRDDTLKVPVDTTRKASAVQSYFKFGNFSDDRNPDTMQMRSIRNTIRDFEVCAMQLGLK